MFLRRFTQPKKPKPPSFKEKPGKMQPGYLWGKGNQLDVIGDEDGWHWRAQEGQALAYWSLWYGGREVGLNTYPTNEVKDWPDILFQMLLGLSGLAECALDDEELDAIRHDAKEAADRAKGFPGFMENKKPHSPYPAGSLENQVWDYTYKNSIAQKAGSEFLKG